ncbi:DivIVA domain-containing protein [Microbacterium sp. MEC084]|jgi:DivIVA domain-containing protein|uniref:DivIVA domain-containing protein n=1 Tax=unclassified Microbacterium TaxID=2609290 RepID=UPI0006FDB68B|nr:MULTISPECIES: DivIVA domain-containing protein [unclassified Microbacterium]KQY99257.1 MFS transporter permease [Microbacterium sp. Root53]MCD1269088.1 DivIVA domain-containing protein [Microbacterium sp. MEC084]
MTGAPPFPAARGREKGYDRAAVDAFLAEARAAFEAGSESALDARTVRETAFPLRRGGYDVGAVDAALARIEDAFAARERERAIAESGPEAWVERARAEAQVILDRLTRPRGERFDRVGRLAYGYAPDEVDAVAERLTRFFESGDPVTVEQVRAAAFRPVRGGYREEQVDAVLDAVVDVMLAVR